MLETSLILDAEKLLPLRMLLKDIIQIECNLPVKADAKALLSIIHKGQTAIQSINSTYKNRLLIGLQQAKEAIVGYETNTSHKLYDLYDITNQVYIVIDACIKLNSDRDTE